MFNVESTSSRGCCRLCGSDSRRNCGRNESRAGWSVDRDSQSAGWCRKEPSYVFVGWHFFFEAEIHIRYSVARMVPGRVWAIKSLTPPISRYDSIKAESGSEALRLGYILFLVLETMSLRA